MVNIMSRNLKFYPSDLRLAYLSKAIRKDKSTWEFYFSRGKHFLGADIYNAGRFGEEIT